MTNGDSLNEYIAADDTTVEQKVEAVTLIDTHIVGRKPDDFEMFNDREHHFLFSMRNKLKLSREDHGPWTPETFQISPKQYKYLKDLILRLLDPDLNRSSKIAYLKKCIPQSKREVTNLKKQLKEAEELLATQEEELAIVSKPIKQKK